MTHNPPQWGAQPHPQPQRPPLPTTRPRPRRGITVLTHLAVAFVALILGIAIGAAASSGTTTDTGAESTAESGTSSDGADSKDSTPADDTPEGTIPGDGTYLVGEDIQPGTYRGEGNSDYTCYWARLSGTSGQLDDIIANGTPTGSEIVTIEETDVAFETTGCSDWTLTE